MLDIKENVTCLNKQQVEGGVAYFLFSYFTVDPKIFHQITGIPMGSESAPFLPNYSNVFMKVSGSLN